MRPVHWAGKSVAKFCAIISAGLLLPAAPLMTACGTPSGSEHGPIEVLPADSGTDLALEFDGVNDYASLGTAGFPFARLPQTISFWVNVSDATGDQSLVTLNKDAASGVRVGLQNGVLSAHSVYSGDVFAQAANPLPLGEWHHVAYLYDGTDSAPHHTLYLDGMVTATGTALPNKRTPTSAFLGCDQSQARPFHGKLDELRVWSVARTADQIADEIAGEAPTQEPPDLVLYYPFNEIAGPRIVDHSGRENHGMLGDGASAYMPARVLSGVAQSRH